MSFFFSSHQWHTETNGELGLELLNASWKSVEVSGLKSVPMARFHHVRGVTIGTRGRTLVNLSLLTNVRRRHSAFPVQNGLLGTQVHEIKHSEKKKQLLSPVY